MTTLANLHFCKACGALIWEKGYVFGIIECKRCGYLNWIKSKNKEMKNRYRKNFKT